MLQIETEKTIDSEGNRAMKSKTCNFFCVRHLNGQQVPCDLYTIRAGREWCSADECQD